MRKVNVAIADDNELMLQLLEEIISEDKELELVGKAKDGVEALEIIKDKQPDIMLLDVVMPNLDGLGVLEKVRNDKDIKTRHLKARRRILFECSRKRHRHCIGNYKRRSYAWR